MYSYFNSGWFMFPVIVWTVAWKGVALWKAARLGHKWWYVALLVINSLGLLEILYIYVFSEKMMKGDHKHGHGHGEGCC